ncbi:uncharacterized protein C8Q71DRAFT_848476 [Rhodofomes roseus]|uniref:Uncharacterized protein n=1 Tax=Rhodofomes roseus TaxID=34475 RepID=A0ABQ8KET2_9APHY|nr:uncharacterized protein C8Q71DRAFT_848476 [Rhodofomes roseus]KAH9836242.1 hypothetical protein C8Q71DRAFT_848476 [Rhodofomes roseus]
MSPCTWLLAFLSLSLAFLILPASSAPTSRLLLAPIPSYFCFNNALIGWNLLVYLGTNYFLHSVSIPAGADIERYTQRVTLTQALWWRATLSVVSLFLPFFALARTTILLAEQFKCKGNDVRAALQHGALLVVVRGVDWEPGEKDEIIYTKVIDPRTTTDDTPAGDQKKQLPLATISFDKVEGKRAYSRVTHESRSLHGSVLPPMGYSLAVPLHKAYTEDIIHRDLEDTGKLKIHHPSGITNVILSIFQIVFAIFTLYFTPSDQIPRWGYAAYGLSVFPYALMSVMNLLCAAFVGGYASGHVLRTPILEESLKRGGLYAQVGNDTWVRYDGLVGTVRRTGSLPPVLSSQPLPPTNEDAVQHAAGEPIFDDTQIGKTGRGSYEAVKMRMKPDGDMKRLFVTVKGAKEPREYHLVTEDKGDAQTTRFTLSALSHDGPIPEEKLNEHQAITPREAWTIACLFIIALVSPHALIYSLTGFHPNGSTVAQRGWMMSWLAADQASSLLTLFFWYAWKNWRCDIPDMVHYICFGLLMIPGVGGIVTVALMFLTDYNFGPNACLSSNSSSTQYLWFVE